MTLLESLLPSLSDAKLSASQKAQYELQSKFFADSKVGWAELLLLAAGGVLAPPEGNTSYSTPIVFNLYPWCRVRPGLPLVVYERRYQVLGTTSWCIVANR